LRLPPDLRALSRFTPPLRRPAGLRAPLGITPGLDAPLRLPLRLAAPLGITPGLDAPFRLSLRLAAPLRFSARLRRARGLRSPLRFPARLGRAMGFCLPLRFPARLRLPLGLTPRLGWHPAAIVSTRDAGLRARRCFDSRGWLPLRHPARLPLAFGRPRAAIADLAARRPSFRDWSVAITAGDTSVRARTPRIPGADHSTPSHAAARRHVIPGTGRPGARAARAARHGGVVRRRSGTAAVYIITAEAVVDERL
jgi:hypothetical protein